MTASAPSASALGNRRRGTNAFAGRKDATVKDGS